MAQDTLELPKPAHKSIRIASDGSAHIEAYRCDDCGAVFADPTLACRRCASRAAPQPFRSSEHGKLYSWSIVERSYPGIEVPFISVIVDLDDGLTLKGTLRDADRENLAMGMPVRLVFDDAGGATDKEGIPYVGFHFVPEGAAQ